MIATSGKKSRGKKGLSGNEYTKFYNTKAVQESKQLKNKSSKGEAGIL